VDDIFVWDLGLFLSTVVITFRNVDIEESKPVKLIFVLF